MTYRVGSCFSGAGAMDLGSDDFCLGARRRFESAQGVGIQNPDCWSEGMRARFISTFAGAGGMDLGLERAGWECVAQIEIDPICQGVLRRHWPDVPKWGDIRDVKGADLPEAELICGGFPCEDVSVAGRRAGLAGARSGLFFEFVRLVRELRPTWLLLENVVGLLSSNRGRDFATILNTLAELGYGLAWRICDSRYWGVAQRRRRVFVVGRVGAPVPAEVLHESPSGRGDLAAGRKTEADIAGTLGAGTTGSGFPVDPDRMTYVPVSAALTTPSSQRLDPNGETYVVADTLRSHPRPGSNSNGAMVATFDERNVTSWANRTRVEFGSPCNTLHAEPLSVIALALRGRDGGADLEWRDDGTYNALRAGDGSSSRQPLVGGAFGVRRLLPVETERLQSVPDNWTALDDQGREIADSHRYRLTGRMVTTNVAEWLARRLMAVLAAS